MKSRGEAVSWREVRGLCRGFWSPCEAQAACWRGGFIWRPQTHTLAGWVFIFSDRTVSYFCTSPDHGKRTTKMSRWLKCTSMYFVGIKILQWYFSLKLCCSFSSFFLCMQKLEGERLIFNWVCVCVLNCSCVGEWLIAFSINSKNSGILQDSPGEWTVVWDLWSLHIFWKACVNLYGHVRLKASFVNAKAFIFYMSNVY